MIILANQQLLSQLLPEQLAAISAEAEARFKPGVECSTPFLQALPHIDQVTKWMAEALPPVPNSFLCASFTTSGRCSYFFMEFGNRRDDTDVVTSGTAPVPNTAGQAPSLGIHIVLIDLRLFYELYTLILASPLAQLEPLVEESLAILKAMLAVRLNQGQDPSLRRFVAALTSQAAHYRADVALSDHDIMRDLAALEKASWLTLRHLETVRYVIASFIAFHEGAHLHFAVSDKFEEKAFENIKKVSYVISRHHADKHDEQAPGGMREYLQKLSEAHRLADFEAAKTIDSKVTEDSVLTRPEIEEWMCDMVAVQSVAFRLVELQRLDRIACLLLHYGIPFFVNVFHFLSSSMKERFAETGRLYNIPYDPRQKHVIADEHCERLAALHVLEERMARRANLRHRLMETNILAAMGLLAEPWVKADSFPKWDHAVDLLSPSSIEYHRWSRYDILFTQLFEKQVTSLEGTRILSSLGRSLLWLIRRHGVEAELAPDADPFALYYLGWVSYPEE